MKTQLIKPIFLFLFLALALPAGVTYGRTLTVAFNDWPPWKTFDQNSRPIGIDAEILKELGKRLNVQVSFFPCHWVRCLISLETGTVDILTSVIRNPEREAYLHYLEPSYIKESRTVFYLNNQSNTSIHTYDDLKKYTVGVVRGYKYFDEFDNDEKLAKEVLSHDLQGFLMLQYGRLDAFASPEISGDYIIYTNGLTDQFKKSEYAIDKNIPLYITISKKSAMVDIIPELETEIRRMVADGTIDKIIREVTSGK